MVTSISKELIIKVEIIFLFLTFIASFALYSIATRDTYNDSLEETEKYNKISIYSVRMMMASLVLPITIAMNHYIHKPYIKYVCIAILLTTILLMINVEKLPIWEE